MLLDTHARDESSDARQPFDGFVNRGFPPDARPVSPPAP